MRLRRVSEETEHSIDRRITISKWVSRISILLAVVFLILLFTNYIDG